MAGSKDKLRYEILEVSKPESLLIRGMTSVLLLNLFFIFVIKYGIMLVAL